MNMKPHKILNADWKTALILVLGLLLAGCATPPPQAQPTSLPAPTQETQPELTILAFGDSLTEGLGVDPQENYPSQLERKLQEMGYNVKVINGGISGETSTAALERLDWMLETRPQIVIVETGANDALRGVDLELTRSNVDKIVGRFSDSGAVVIVAGLQIIQNLGEDYTQQFAEIYPAAAEKYDAILIPFVLEGVAANPELNQADFIHPTAEGYAVMVEHITPFVLEAISQAESQ